MPRRRRHLDCSDDGGASPRLTCPLHTPRSGIAAFSAGLQAAEEADGGGGGGGPRARAFATAWTAAFAARARASATLGTCRLPPAIFLSSCGESIRCSRRQICCHLIADLSIRPTPTSLTHLMLPPYGTRQLTTWRPRRYIRRHPARHNPLTGISYHCASSIHRYLVACRPEARCRRPPAGSRWYLGTEEIDCSERALLTSEQAWRTPDPDAVPAAGRHLWARFACERVGTLPPAPTARAAHSVVRAARRSRRADRQGGDTRGKVATNKSSAVPR